MKKLLQEYTLAELVDLVGKSISIKPYGAIDGINIKVASIHVECYVQSGDAFRYIKATIKDGLSTFIAVNNSVIGIE